MKEWPEIKNPKKYAGQKVIIGTVTDGYNPLEETYGKTRKILEELKDSGADILICTTVKPIEGNDFTYVDYLSVDTAWQDKSGFGTIFSAEFIPF